MFNDDKTSRIRKWRAAFSERRARSTRLFLLGLVLICGGTLAVGDAIVLVCGVPDGDGDGRRLEARGGGLPFPRPADIDALLDATLRQARGKPNVAERDLGVIATMRT